MRRRVRHDAERNGPCVCHTQVSRDQRRARAKHGGVGQPRCGQQRQLEFALVWIIRKWAAIVLRAMTQIAVLHDLVHEWFECLAAVELLQRDGPQTLQSRQPAPVGAFAERRLDGTAVAHPHETASMGVLVDVEACPLHGRDPVHRDVGGEILQTESTQPRMGIPDGAQRCHRKGGGVRRQGQPPLILGLMPSDMCQRILQTAAIDAPRLGQHQQPDQTVGVILLDDDDRGLY